MLELAGLYLMTVDVVTVTHAPFHGRVQVSTRSTSVATLKPAGDAYEMHQRLCSVVIENDSNVARTVVPEAFIRSVPPLSYPATLEGQWFEADPGLRATGWDPSEAESLPQRPKDPGVIDPDHDDHPGVTVHLHVPVFGQVGLYVAQAIHVAYRGKVNDEGVISGPVQIETLRQRTLSASNFLFAVNPEVEPIPGASSFALRPLSPGEGCPEGGSEPD